MGRYRNFMAAFEDMSRRFVTARRSSDAAAAARREAMLDDLIANTGKPDIGYEAPAKARPFFRDTTRALEALAMTLADATRADAISTFDLQQADRSAHRKATPGAAPRPKMRLFMRPLADNDPRAESATLP